jgi:regulatory protein
VLGFEPAKLAAEHTLPPQSKFWLRAARERTATGFAAIGNIIRSMPTITAIERIKFKRRADIWLDGEKAFALSLELIALARLESGIDLTPERQAELRDKDEREQALAAALRLLSLSPRSERDLRQRLRRRGLGAEAVSGAVERMRELGYLNDAAFARGYVEARQASTPRSRRYLTFELGQRGVAREHAAGALDGVSDDDAAYEAAQRRLRSLQGADYATFQRRLGSFLAGRGFGYGVARSTIERCWREMSEAEAG